MRARVFPCVFARARAALRRVARAAAAEPQSLFGARAKRAGSGARAGATLARHAHQTAVARHARQTTLAELGSALVPDLNGQPALCVAFVSMRMLRVSCLRYGTHGLWIDELLIRDTKGKT